MVATNYRDRTRTTVSRTDKLHEQHRKPPPGERFGWFTEAMMLSPAFRALSKNAMKSLHRLVIEYLQQGRRHNGQLICTHENFRAYGVTGDLVANSIDELVFFGFTRVKRGRAADGTAHPSLYRLTFYGDHEGAAPSNEWKGITEESAARWAEVRLVKAAERARTAGRRKNSSLRKHGIARSVNTELVEPISRSAGGKG